MPEDMQNRINPVQRASLPNSAQSWLNRALPLDFDLPSSIRIEQEGAMEVRGNWTPFTARGVYKAPPLSFNWQARFRILPGVWLVVEDGHLAGQGWGNAKLWGVISMGKRTDPEVLLTQLVRNLAELAWVPAFALADPTLSWSDAGERAFEVRATGGDREIIVRFAVDEKGDVIRAYSPARPYDVPGGYAEAPWYYQFSEHREFAGVRIPSTGVATFEKASGPQEYFRGRIVSVSYGTAPA
jgi:hypothetical protein